MTSAPVLTISDLVVAYGSRSIPAVKGVSLVVRRGETVALVGESGSGKSSTIHALLGLLPRNAHVSGSVTFDGQDLLALRPAARREILGDRIGFVPQDPTVSLNPTKRVGAQIAEAIRIHNRELKGQALQDRVVELLDLVGIKDPRRRASLYPHELSGGMRQRVLIAAALANEPELLVADEPTSALDVTVQQQILDHIDLLRSELGIAVLLITHDLGVASDRADRIVVLSDGRVAEAGAAAQVVENPKSSYARSLIEAVPTIHHGRLTWDDEAQAAVPLAESCPALPSDVILDAKRLRKTFRGGRHGETVAVDDVSFTLRRGRTLGIVGESGSGKSTLSRLITRLESTDEGTIEFAGRDITYLAGRELRRLRREVQIVYQNPRASLDPKFTIGRTLAEPLRATGVPKAEIAQRVADLLELVNLPGEFAERRPHELSGGQLQRVAIARALATSPDLVVLDEPVSALDVSVQAQILALLVRLQQQLGVTMIFVSHDLAVIRQVSDEVLVMHDGRVAEWAPADEVFTSPKAAITRTLLDAIPGVAGPGHRHVSRDEITPVDDDARRLRPDDIPAFDPVLMPM